MSNDFPRRNRIYLMTPAELAIRAAVQAVEEAGAHPLLTDAVILLGKAQATVADFVDKDDPTQQQFVGYPRESGERA